MAPSSSAALTPSSWPGAASTPLCCAASCWRKRSTTTGTSSPMPGARLRRADRMDDVVTKILLVEDDELLREAFRLLLEDVGYEVREAGTAAEALHAFADDQPALVLLDL